MDRTRKLEELLEQTPSDSFVQHALALEYIKAGRYAEARNLFETLLNREPGYTGSYYHLAGLLQSMGEKEEAIRVYEKGLEESKKAGEMHTYNELKSALEELIF